jgi:conjugative relaxase-like TrwC/TraI family protein
LFEVQKLGTAVYRLELAKKMTELGYKIKVDEKTKTPEISAVSREYIEAVSPRQNEIKEKARELNIVSTGGIAVRYRSAKEEMHRTEETETKEEPAFSIAKTNSFRYPSDEEIEAYENEMYTQDCERSLNL